MQQSVKNASKGDICLSHKKQLSIYKALDFKKSCYRSNRFFCVQSCLLYRLGREKSETAESEIINDLALNFLTFYFSCLL